MATGERREHKEASRGGPTAAEDEANLSTGRRALGKHRRDRMSGENKAAMKRIGYFGEAGYVGIGDPYKSKHKESMSRYEGAQFQTNPKFVSDTRFKLTNGMFSKAAALYVVRYMSIALLDDKHTRLLALCEIITRRPYVYQLFFHFCMLPQEDENDILIFF